MLNRSISISARSARVCRHCDLARGRKGQSAALGVELLTAERVAETMMRAIEERTNGAQWVVWGGYEDEQYAWNQIRPSSPPCRRRAMTTDAPPPVWDLSTQIFEPTLPLVRGASQRRPSSPHRRLHGCSHSARRRVENTPRPRIRPRYRTTCCSPDQ